MSWCALMATDRTLAKRTIRTRKEDSGAGENGLSIGKGNKGLATYNSLERNQYFPQGYFGKEFQLELKMRLPLDTRQEKILLLWDPGAEL